MSVRGSRSSKYILFGTQTLQVDSEGHCRRRHLLSKVSFASVRPAWRITTGRVLSALTCFPSGQGTEHKFLRLRKPEVY